VSDLSVQFRDLEQKQEGSDLEITQNEYICHVQKMSGFAADLLGV
jgi:hypothetical protein